MTRAPLHGQVIAIVGLGLMGGSLGLALAGSGMHRIGVAADATSAQVALARGAVDEAMSFDEACARADVVLLATPVREIVRLVPLAAAAMRPGCVLTDVGSTKQEIVAAMEAAGGGSGVSCVGGHPMCGRHTAGVAHADPSLFQGATFVLVPTSTSTPESLALLRRVIEVIGSAAVQATAAVHDEAAAVASHLPLASGAALARVLGDATARLPLAHDLASSGFRDATRTAGGDTTMWTDVLVSNREHVRAALVALEARLAELRGLLDDPDGPDASSVAAWLSQARDVRRSFD